MALFSRNAIGASVSKPHIAINVNNMCVCVSVCVCVCLCLSVSVSVSVCECVCECIRKEEDDRGSSFFCEPLNHGDFLTKIICLTCSRTASRKKCHKKIPGATTYIVVDR
jgi:hypothetical protein